MPVFHFLCAATRTAYDTTSNGSGEPRILFNCHCLNLNPQRDIHAKAKRFACVEAKIVAIERCRGVGTADVTLVKWMGYAFE